MFKVVGIPSRKSGSPYRMSGSGREALPDVWEESGDPPECLVGLPGCSEVLGGPSKYPEVVGRPSRMSASGRKALSDGREWSRCSLGCPGAVGMPYRMSGIVWEAVLDVWQLKGGPPGCPGVVGKSSRIPGSGWEAPKG